MSSQLAVARRVGSPDLEAGLPGGTTGGTRRRHTTGGYPDPPPAPADHHGQRGDCDGTQAQQ